VCLVFEKIRICAYRSGQCGGWPVPPPLTYILDPSVLSLVWKSTLLHFSSATPQQLNDSSPDQLPDTQNAAEIHPIIRTTDRVGVVRNCDKPFRPIVVGTMAIGRRSWSGAASWHPPDRTSCRRRCEAPAEDRIRAGHGRRARSIPQPSVTVPS